MNYEDSYAKAFPFDNLIDGMLNSQMIEDAIIIIQVEPAVAKTLDPQNSAQPNEKGVASQSLQPLDLIGSGGQIWTDDLRVMSPTSYRTAPPRAIL